MNNAGNPQPAYVIRTPFVTPDSVAGDGHFTINLKAIESGPFIAPAPPRMASEELWKVWPPPWRCGDAAHIKNGVAPTFSGRSGGRIRSTPYRRDRQRFRHISTENGRR